MRGYSTREDERKVTGRKFVDRELDVLVSCEMKIKLKGAYVFEGVKGRTQEWREEKTRSDNAVGEEVDKIIVKR